MITWLVLHVDHPLAWGLIINIRKVHLSIFKSNHTDCSRKIRPFKPLSAFLTLGSYFLQIWLSDRKIWNLALRNERCNTWTLIDLRHLKNLKKSWSIVKFLRKLSTVTKKRLVFDKNIFQKFLLLKAKS